MTQDNLMIIIAFALYLGLMMYIGVYYGDFWCMDCRRPHIRHMGELEIRF